MATSSPTPKKVVKKIDKHWYFEDVEGNLKRLDVYLASNKENDCS